MSETTPTTAHQGYCLPSLGEPCGSCHRCILPTSAPMSEAVGGDWPNPREASTAQRLVALSRWIDKSNADRDPEVVTWGRLAKLTEEAGEVIAAYIGFTGQNPRKGQTHTTDDVIEELLDVAVTALCAVEHMTRLSGTSIDLFDDKVLRVAARAGMAGTDGCEGR